MGTIVRNNERNGTIYRYGGNILRTPIKITLEADGKAIYQIGDQRSADSSGFLHGGFIESGTTIAAVKNAGFMLVNEMVNGHPVWKDASGAHDPEFVWYQGAYSTSRSSIPLGKTMSEAYAAICAFHFTVPSNLRGKFQQVEVDFLNMGATWAYGPARAGNINNKNIRAADYGWVAGDVGFPVAFHLLTSSTPNYHLIDINENSACDWYDIGLVGSAGEFRGSRDIWQLAGNDYDGYIPTLTNPIRTSYNLGATTKSQFISNNGGWIVPTIHPVFNQYDTNNYQPSSGWGGNGANNYWACVSLRDVKVKLVIE